MVLYCFALYCIVLSLHCVVFYCIDVRLSVRWCAPEVILHRQVMRKSDVWSFGIVLIEMFSKGAVPYQGQEQRFHFPNSYVV